MHDDVLFIFALALASWTLIAFLVRSVLQVL